MIELTEKAVVDSRKVLDLARVIDDKLVSLYPAEWQRESLDTIQNLMMVLIEQAEKLCDEVEKIGTDSLLH